MKTYLLITACILVSLTAIAQEEVARAAKEACGCLKELDPAQHSERDLKISMLGCLSKPIDAIAEELTKKGTWADSSAFYYLGKIGMEVRALCPGEYERLKKKEIEVDPALLKIQPNAETVAGFAQAVCNCVGVTKDLDGCMKRVGSANEEELTKRFPDDPFTAMMSIGMEVMFELADHCEAAAASSEAIATFKKIPAVKEGCNKIVLGNFVTPSMTGETKSTFTPTNLKEFSDGKLSAEYELKWNNCTITMKCLSSNSEFVKKGEVSTMEIRRGSSEGFIAFVSFGKMKVPVNYKKAN